MNITPCCARDATRDTDWWEAKLRKRFVTYECGCRAVCTCHLSACGNTCRGHGCRRRAWVGVKVSISAARVTRLLKAWVYHLITVSTPHRETTHTRARTQPVSYHARCRLTYGSGKSRPVLKQQAHHAARYYFVLHKTEQNINCVHVQDCRQRLPSPSSEEHHRHRHGHQVS